MKERFYALDFLRFLAAMSVVLFHYAFEVGNLFNQGPPQFPVLGGIFKYGYMGVDAFFMISGFVILLSASSRTPVEFAISRITRLYPAYWLATVLLFMFAILWPIVGFPVSWTGMLMNLTMFQKWFGVPDVSYVFWTLIIELQFYIFILLLLVLKQLHRIEWVFLFWISLSVASDYIVFGLGNIELNNLVRDALILYWCPYFIAGAIFYKISQNGFSKLRLVLLFISYFQILLHANWIMQMEVVRTEVDHNFIIVGLIITGVFLIFYSVSTFKINTRLRIIAKLGVLTYPLYLIHSMIGGALLSRYFEVVDKYLLLTSVTLVLILVSFLIYRFVERPFAPMLKKLLERILRTHNPHTGAGLANSSNRSAL